MIDSGKRTVMQGIPKVIRKLPSYALDPSTELVEVRGEVYLTRENFGKASMEPADVQEDTKKSSTRRSPHLQAPHAHDACNKHVFRHCMSCLEPKPHFFPARMLCSGQCHAAG